MLSKLIQTEIYFVMVDSFKLDKMHISRLLLGFCVGLNDLIFKYSGLGKKEVLLTIPSKFSISGSE